MTRIAFISTMEGYPWGGSEELWGRAATRLMSRGVTVAASVKSWAKPAAQIEALKEQGCLVFPRRPASRMQRLAKRAGIQPRYRWLEDFKPDLVVISQGDQNAGRHWPGFCAACSIPYAQIVQAACEQWWLDDADIERSTREYEGARAVYFVSEGNLKIVQSQLASDLKNGKVIRNPFNVSYNAHPKWPDGVVIKLACVARLEPGAKGHDVLFDVLRQPKWRQRPIEVTLFGHGPNSQNLAKMKDFYQLDHVHFGGFVSDIEEIWAGHHALVLPSRFEGLPLAVVEAMLCGRPCIVSDVSGNTELLEDNVSGFVAAAPTPRLFDEALERAWQRRAEWPEIGLKAAQRVRQLVPPDPAEVFAQELMQLVS